MLNSSPLPSSKTTADLIADRLREAISTGQIPSGSALKQDVIAKELSVSKIPVREALHQLKKEGLVEIRPNRGAVVTHLTFEEIDEIFAMRIALESLALRRAMPHMTAATFSEAEAILRQLDEEANLERWAQLNWAFHLTLYKPANMNHLMETVESLHANVGRYLRLTNWGDENYLLIPQKEHWELLDLCRRQELNLAQLTLEKHMRAPVAHLRKHM